MVFSITNTSLGGGSKGLAYSSANFASSGGTGAVTWSLRSGTLPFGTNMVGNGGKNDQMAGNTVAITNAQNNNTVTGNMTRWQNIPAFPIAWMKIYCDTVSSFPTTINNHMQGAIDHNTQVIVSYRPTWLGTSSPANNWPGGAVYPSQNTIQNDSSGMITSIQALRNLGLLISGIVLWQEIDDLGKHQIGSTTATIAQMTYIYSQHYPLMKAAMGSNCPLIGIIFTGYNEPYDDATLAASWIPGPTANRPGDTRFIDFIGQDTYAPGWNNADANGNPVLGTGKRYPFNGPTHLGTIAANMTSSKFPNGIGWGMTELGNQAGSGNPNQNFMTAFISSDANQYTYGDPTNSMEAAYSQMQDNNQPVTPFMWYEDDSAFGLSTQGANDIPGFGVSPATSDFRVPLLQTMNAAAGQFTQPANIQGTPTANGTYTVELRATDSTGAQAHKTLSITIGNTVAATTLTGAGNLTSPDAKLGAAGIPAGAGALAGFGGVTLRQAVALSGAGILLAGTKIGADAEPVAVSALGSPLVTQQTQKTLSGAGQVTALTSPATNGVPNAMGAAGAIRAAALPLVAGGAETDGMGLLAGTATQNTLVAVTGSGGLTGLATQNTVGPLAGAGVIVARAVEDGNATLVGAGVLTDKSAEFAAIVLNGLGNTAGFWKLFNVVQVTGAGSVAAVAAVKSNAALAGAGVLNNASEQQADPHLIGAGTVTAMQTGMLVSALTGNSAITARATVRITAAISGFGGVNNILIARMVVALSGAGLVSGLTGNNGSASLAGSGGINTPAFSESGITFLEGSTGMDPASYIRGKSHVAYGAGKIKAKARVTFR